MNNNIATSKKKANIVGIVFGIIATLVFAGLLIWECVQFVSNLSSNFEWMIENIKYLEYGGYGIVNFVNLITYDVLIPVSYTFFILLLTAYSFATVIMKGYGNKVLYFITFIAGILYGSILTVSIILEAAMEFIMSGGFSGALMLIFLFAIMAGVAMIIGLLIAVLAGIFRKKAPYIIFGIAGAIAFLVSRLFDVVSFLFLVMLWFGSIGSLSNLSDPASGMLEFIISSPRLFEITSLTIASIAIVVVVLFLHPKSKERK